MAGKSSRLKTKIFRLRKRSSSRKLGKLKSPWTVNLTMATKVAMEVVAEEEEEEVVDVVKPTELATTVATKGETATKST